MNSASASREDIVSELKRILAEDLFVEVPVEKMKESDSLNTDLGLDSVGMVEFVTILEERYGLSIEMKDSAPDLVTIGSVADFILKQRQPVTQP